MVVGDRKVSAGPLTVGVVAQVGGFEGDAVEFVHEEGVGDMPAGVMVEFGAEAGSFGAVAGEGGIKDPGVGEEGAAC